MITNINHFERKFQELGLERDKNNRLILYHATLGRSFASILAQGVIAPPIKTGNRQWRLEHERGIEISKVYLALPHKARAIAETLQRQFGGSAYILRVHVEEDRLAPDEDTRAETWQESLSICSNFGGTCSYKGSIYKFEVLERLSYKLPLDRHFYYFAKCEGATPKEEATIFDEMQKECKRLANDEMQLIKRGRAIAKYRRLYRICQQNNLNIPHIDPIESDRGKLWKQIVCMKNQLKGAGIGSG